MQPLRVIFAGSGEFGLPTLKALRDAGHDLLQVISQPDRPAGRGRTLTPTPISAWTAAQNLPLQTTADINALPLPPADVLVVIAFGQKIGPAVTAAPRFGAVNLHASLLPRHRGAAPINWAIAAGDTETGNSVIRLAPRMDAGAVLAQSRFPIGEIETAGELHDRLAQDGPHIILRVLQDLADSRAAEQPQDEAAVTIAPKLSREFAALDWTRPAAEIARRIRACSPWPLCRVSLSQPSKAPTDLGLLRARDVDGPAAEPAVLVDRAGTLPVIAAGDGRAVEILEVLPPGKRPMPLSAYANGSPWKAGMRVGPTGS